jgi:IS30 family transposase
MTHHNTAPGTAAARKFALARRAEMVRLYQGGLSETEIAERMDCCLRTVQRHLMGSGIRQPGDTAPGTRMTDDEITRARLMLEDGQSYHAVAKVMGRYMRTIERNVPGFPKLTMAERAERGVLGRQLRRVERRLRL